MVAFLGMGLTEWLAWIVATVAAITALELKFREERKQMAEQSETPTAEPAGEPAGLDTEAMRRDAQEADNHDSYTDEFAMYAGRCVTHTNTLLGALAAANERAEAAESRAERYREALDRIAAETRPYYGEAMDIAIDALEADSQHQHLQPRADAAGAMPDGPGEEQGGGVN